MSWGRLLRWLWERMQYRADDEPLPPPKPWEVPAPWDRRRRLPARQSWWR